MPADSVSPSERATAAIAKLSSSAANINKISNDLAKPVAELESVLQRLNIGVACWVTFASGRFDNAAWQQDVGYALVSGRWCIAIRDDDAADDPEIPPDEWPFNEAPRHLRIKAVDKLVDLLEALSEASDATAKRIEQKIEPTREVVAAVLARLGEKKK